jgi:hypothetical protein
MELGSVTLKRIGFFVFQLNTQHTHTHTRTDIIYTESEKLFNSRN